ncbi:MAG: protein kinase, partial [Deltaproteobacteria bacterium]|nr:protein kinase [Deltaproteobacteria bacterium]
FYKTCLKKELNEFIIEYLVNRLGDEIKNVSEQLPTENISLHRHEAWAIDKIRERVERLTQTGRVISNYWIYDRESNDYYECDIVLIAASGIYIIELKHWTGRIEVRPNRWRINGTQHRKDPHLVNAFKCRILKGICARSVPACADRLRVESVVVLTNPEAECIGNSAPRTDKHNPTFDGLDDLFAYLRYRQKCAGDLLTHLQVDALYRELVKLQVEQPVSGYNFPGYEIVEKLTQRPDLLEVLVRPLDSGIRGLQRFRVFNPDPDASLTERQRFLARARNTLKTVAKTGDHPNILKVWDRTGDDGIPVEGSDWSEAGTLADLIADHAGGLEKKKAMIIFKGILNGLEIIHDKDIVHRALKPDNILMIGDTPKLMNFDLAFHLEPDEEHITVLPDASKIKEDPYVAPEVLSKGDCIPASDLFSAGVILYQMLTGSRPFKRSTDLAKSGGRMTEEARERVFRKGIPEDLLDVINSLIQLDMNRRPQSVGQVRELLALTEEPYIEPANRQLRPGEHYDVYQIERLIRRGGKAQVYHARRANAGYVALKLFNQEVPVERIYAEERAMRAVDSPFVVRCEHLGCWENDRHFLVMNFVEGENLRDIIRQGKRPSFEKFTGVTRCLLQAVEHLHFSGEGVTWLHNDIKPENVLLRDDEAVLLDLGIAREPGVGACMGTAGYIAPDLVDGADLNYCVSGDLFALGVTLFEWVAGKRPYEQMIVGKIPADIRQLRPDLPEPIASWLEKSVLTRAADRFSDVKSMREAFDRALEEVAGVPGEEPAPSPQLPVTELPESTLDGNPFVEYLNTLHNLTSSNENALAESQARNPFRGYIHVPNKVTDFILDTVSGEEPRHVILTGHAGDGKSMIGLEIYLRLHNLPLDQTLSDDLKPVEELDLPQGRRVIIIKDMSELTVEEKVAHLKTACSEGSDRYLIISNTGALLEALEAYFSGGYRWAEEQSRVLEALSVDSPSELLIDKGKFEVINLSLVDNLQTAVELLKRMVASERWEGCEEKDCRQICPVYLNAKLIRDNWEIVSERVHYAYRRLFEYGERLTLRQISAHLAYAITCGLDYEGIRAMARLPNPPLKNELLFSNRFFGEGASGKKPEADQLKAVRLLRQLDVGARPFPALEHRLWARDEENILPDLPPELGSLFNDLRACGRNMYTLPEDGDAIQPRNARRQMRRILYFFAKLTGELSDFIPVFLNSIALPRFVRWQCTGQWESQREREEIRKGILHVILEQFTGIRLPEDTPLDDIFITLNRGRSEIRQSAQIVLARFNGQDFAIELRERDSRIGSARYTPILIKHGTDANLPLDLPLLDYVLMRHGGEVGQRLHSSYVDRLERFKNALLSLPEVANQKKEDMLLVRLRTNSRFVTQTYSVDPDRGIVEVY